MRERDFFEDGFTRLVKVGLVKESITRDSYLRRDDHQTGNPRQLVISDDFIVKTHSVSKVESQLHKRFATKWIHGEWFKFDNDQELISAVSLARELSEEMAEFQPIFERYQELQNTPHVGDTTISPSPEAVEIAKTRKISKWKMNQCDEMLKTIVDQFWKAWDAGVDLDGVVGIYTQSQAPTFKKDNFKEEYPELYEEYNRTKKRFSKQFSIAAGAAKPDDNSETTTHEFIVALNKIRAEIDEISVPNYARSLIKPYQKLLSLKAEIKWEYDYAEARLGIECDTNYRLGDLGTWSRRLKEETKFRHTELKAEQENIYNKYLSKKPSTLGMYYQGKKVLNGTREVPEFADS